MSLGIFNQRTWSARMAIPANGHAAAKGCGGALERATDPLVDGLKTSDAQTGNSPMVLTAPTPRAAGLFTTATSDAQSPAAEATPWALPGGVVDGGEIILFAVKPSMWRPALDSAAWIVTSVLLATTLLVTGRAFPGLSLAMTAQCVLVIGFGRLAIAITQWIPTWYLLTNRRLIEIRGVRTPIVQSCPLVDVRNTYLNSSTFERPLGLGTITYVCNRDGNPPRLWESLADAEQVHTRIRRAIENALDHFTPEA